MAVGGFVGIHHQLCLIFGYQLGAWYAFGELAHQYVMFPFAPLQVGAFAATGFVNSKRFLKCKAKACTGFTKSQAPSRLGMTTGRGRRGELTSPAAVGAGVRAGAVERRHAVSGGDGSGGDRPQREGRKGGKLGDHGARGGRVIDEIC